MVQRRLEHSFRPTVHPVHPVIMLPLLFVAVGCGGDKLGIKVAVTQSSEPFDLQFRCAETAWFSLDLVCFNMLQLQELAFQVFPTVPIHPPHILYIPGFVFQCLPFFGKGNISMATRWCMQRTARSKVGKFALQPGSQDTSSAR